VEAKEESKGTSWRRGEGLEGSEEKEQKEEGGEGAGTLKGRGETSLLDDEVFISRGEREGERRERSRVVEVGS